MATLHVRNVPDELYELLRERASANDRSIGAETVQLLQERLALAAAGPPPRRVAFPSRRRGGGSSPFAHFTPEARAVVVEAQERVRSLGHDHVGTEHLLLAVLVRGAEKVVGKLGLTAGRVEEEIVARSGRGETAPAGQLHFGPDAKQALELALRESLALRDAVIAPHHILLGVVGQQSGLGAEIVRAIVPDATKLRECLIAARMPETELPLRRFMPKPSFRVILLDGDAETWETQLNDAAALGYDLVEVVDRRAIMRRV